MKQPSLPTEWPYFFPATIHEWKHLLENVECKMIIINAIKFLVEAKRIRLTAFVIMSNHIHIIWQPLPGHTRTTVQSSFMKYTAQHLKYYLEKNDILFLEVFKVNKKDRMYQFWKRNALSVELFNEKAFYQKVEYIHFNPVKAGLCLNPQEYRSSSASFYENGIDNFLMFTLI